MDEGFAHISAILFSEFDATLGPRVSRQVPEGFTTKNADNLDFESLSEFIIPKSDQAYGN